MLEKEGRGDTMISNCASIGSVMQFILILVISEEAHQCICVCVCVCVLGVVDLDDAHLVGYESSV